MLVGTTNRDDYANDATGNTRLLPVRATRADFALVEAIREQLWAEAVELERSGQPIHLRPEYMTDAVIEQEARVAVDVWQGLIASWLDGKAVPITTSFEVMHACLGIPKERMSRRDEMRVAVVLRACGWKPLVWKLGEHTRRGWRRADVGQEAAIDAAKAHSAGVVAPADNAGFAAPAIDVTKNVLTVDFTKQKTDK